MWHYVQNEQACGPVEISALQTLLKNGSLGPDALVWKEGMTDWLAARAVPELAASIPSRQPPPPIPPLSLPPKAPSPNPIPDDQDVEYNRVYAVLAYLSILFLVPLLAAPQSKFARYHTNQGIILFIATTFLWFGYGVPFFNVFMAPVHSFLGPVALVFMALGIIHAANGECKPLPLIGHFQILGPG